jgi:hypothetical protein
MNQFFLLRDNASPHTSLYPREAIATMGCTGVLFLPTDASARSFTIPAYSISHKDGKKYVANEGDFVEK